MLPYYAQAARRGTGLYSDNYDTIVVGGKGVTMQFLNPKTTNGGLNSGNVIALTISPANGTPGHFFTPNAIYSTSVLTITVTANPDTITRIGYIYAENTNHRFDTITIIQPARRCVNPRLGSAGKNFLVAFMENISNNDANGKLFLYATGDEDAIVTIKQPNGTPYTTGVVNAVPANSIQAIYTVNSNPSTSPAYNYVAETPQPNSFFVESDKAISLYAYNAQNTSSDAASIIPLEVLGNEYYALSYNSSAVSPNTPEEFMVIATENNTLVTIVPQCTTATQGNPPLTSTTYTASKPAQNPFTIRLKKGETYLVKAHPTGSSSNNVYNATLTGSYIKANKPIAVFAGHKRASIATKATNRDHLYAQMLPLELWGTQYIAVSTPEPTVSADNRYRILAANDTTTVTIAGMAPITLNRGAFYEGILTKTQKYVTITSDKPIAVALFEESTPTTSGGIGDPYLLVLSPVTSGVSSVTFSPFHLIATGEKHYVTVLVETSKKNSTTFTMDNAFYVQDDYTTQIRAAFVDMPNGYSYAIQSVTIRDGFNYHLKNPYGLTAYAYGHANAESYGYLLGMFYTTTSTPVLQDTAYCLGEPSKPLPSCFGGCAANEQLLYYNSLSDWENLQHLPTAPVITTDKDTTFLYYVSYPTACGVPYPNEMKIKVFAPASLVFRDTAICLRSTATDYGATPSGGAYTFKGTATVFNHQSAGEGRHNVVYTYTNVAGCVQEDSAWITVQTPHPTISTNKPTTFCRGNDVILNVTGTGIDSIQWRWNNTLVISNTIAANTNDYTVSPSGTHYANGRYAAYTYDDMGCETTVDTLITIVEFLPRPVIKPMYSDPVAFCLGDSVTLSDSIVRPGLPYQWHKNANSIPGEITPSYKVTGNNGGNYTLGVAQTIAGRPLSEACWSYDTILITVWQPPVLLYLNPDMPEICVEDDSVQISVYPPNAQYTYEWTYDNEITSPVTFSSTGTSIWAKDAGLYKAVAISTHSCRSASQQARLTVRPMPRVPIVLLDAAIVCGDKSRTIWVQSTHTGEEYQWYRNDAHDPTNIIYAANKNDYEVRSPGRFAVRATIQYSNALSCHSYSDTSALVEMYPVPLAPIVSNAGTSDTVCDGFSIPLGASQPIGDIAVINHYEWFKNDSSAAEHTGNTLTVTERGSVSYKVLAYSNNGCVSPYSNPKTVMVRPVPVVVAPEGLELCDGASGLLQAYPADPRFRYDWYKNSIIINSYDEDYLFVPTTGTLTRDTVDIYYVNVFDGMCTSVNPTNNARVTVHALPAQPTLTVSPTSICEQKDVTFTASAARATAYEWYKAELGQSTYRLDTIINGATTYSKTGVTVADAGAYTVGAINRHGCRSAARSTPVSLSVLPLPTVYFTNSTVCETSQRYDDVMPLGGTFSGTGCSNPAFFNPSEAGRGAFAITYTYTTSAGCTSDVTQLITVIESPGIPLIYTQQPTTVCVGAAVSAALQTTSLDPNYQYQWYRDNIAIPTATGNTYLAQNKGDYTLQVQNQNLCWADAPSNVIRLTEYPATPTPVIAASNPAFCPDGSVDLSVQTSLNGIFQWVKQNGGRMDNIPNAITNAYTVTDVGTYAIRALDTNNCFTDISNTISVWQYPTPNVPLIVSTATEYFYGKDYMLNVQAAEDGVRYEWFRNDIATNTVGADYWLTPFKEEDVADYTVRATDANQCEIWSDRYHIPLSVVDKREFFIPNIFTPNGDGVNDFFEIIGIDTYKSNKLEILNKKGRVIYSTANYANDWDGGEYPSDVYYYVLEVIDVDRRSNVHRGFVHIKR
ncbi:hypothetical protein FACS189452_00430 [Bacteroidia bacterium]|nr:hypothetical protein FACS189452_00430 [Bacteroidia bacterium]